MYPAMQDRYIVMLARGTGSEQTGAAIEAAPLTLRLMS